MSATIRAVVAEALGGPNVLALGEDRPTPRPGAGKVAIAVRAAGVNFADILSRRSGYRRGAKSRYKRVRAS